MLTTGTYRTDKTNRAMKLTRTCVLLAGMATLLLAGCRSGCEEEKNSRPEETSLDCFVPRNDEGTASMDSMENDSIRKFYERMERWEMLHGGMSRWESDK